MSDKIYFPDITPPSYPFGEEYEDTSIISQFEDGSQQSRSAKTRSRRKWQLEWKGLHQKEYNILMNFVVKVAKFAANSFYWKVSSKYDASYQFLNPYEEEVKVRITKVGEWKCEQVVYWNGSLELTEV